MVEEDSCWIGWLGWKVGWGGYRLVGEDVGLVGKEVRMFTEHASWGDDVQLIGENV